jgi:hypothetical protein
VDRPCPKEHVGARPLTGLVGRIVDGFNGAVGTDKVTLQVLPPTWP